MRTLIGTLARTAAFLGLQGTMRLLAIIVLLPLGMSALVKDLRLGLQGVEVIATVTAVQEVTLRDRWLHTQEGVRVEYDFEAPTGDMVNGRATFSRRAWDRNGGPATLPVRVLPLDPQVHAIRPSPPGVALMWAGVLLALCLWQLVLAWPVVRSAWQIQRLLAQPIWREARVSGIAEERGLFGSLRYLEWRDHVGRIARSRFPLEPWQALTPGDTIRVLVDPLTGQSHWEYET